MKITVQDCYKRFNRAGFEKFGFVSSIYFEFKDDEYIVSVHPPAPLTRGVESQQITKLYNEQLTNAEIDELIRTIKKAHKEFIEEKTKQND